MASFLTRRQRQAHARLDYRQELGQARAVQVVQQKKDRNCEIDTHTECWLFTGSTNNNGYGQIFTKKNSELERTGRDAQTAFLLHRVAYLAANGIDCQHHGSHLCDMPKCFNPDHIVDETPQVNNSRKGCVGSIYCSVHGHLIVDLCPHFPKCIRPPRDDVFCCLSLKESDAAWETQRESPQEDSQMSVNTTATRLSAADILSRASSEYEGAEYLEAAARLGLLDDV
jgi:hypothetical protein